MSHHRFLSLLSVCLLATAVSFGCTSPVRSTSGAGGSGTGTGGSGASTGTGGSGTRNRRERQRHGRRGGRHRDHHRLRRKRHGGGPPRLGAQAATGTGGSGGGGNTGGSTGTGGAGTGTGGTPVKMACVAATSDPLSYTSGYTPDATNHSNAMSIATAMSNDEKAQQMSGLPQSGTANFNVFTQEDNGNRSIRGFHYRDGPRGVNLNATSDGQGDFATAFPVAMARGAAFDPDLEFEIGESIGDEMLASGNTMVLAPTVNILRHPAWGRAQETYGEDMFLLGRLGSAFTAGVQQYVGACAKHYARQQRRGRPRDGQRDDGRGDAARDLRASLRDDHPGGGRLVGHGLVQRGQRDALDAERAPADRPSAHRLRVPGLRSLRLVGDAERPDVPVSGRERARPHRARGGERRSRYGAPLAVQLLDALLARVCGEPAGFAADHLHRADSRAEVPFPTPTRRAATG